MKRIPPFSVYRSLFTAHRLPIILLLLLAFFLRIYQLSSAPVGINGDELFNAIDARQIGSGHWHIFFAGNQGREALFLYLMAASMRLLGKTIFAFRFPAVLLGTGVVLLGYLLGRDLFNRRVGLLTAALITVSLWPLMQSRWGLRAVSLTFFTAFTLYWFQRGLHHGRFRDWLLGGVSLGLTLYTYIPARLFPLVILAWLGWLGWQQRPLLRQRWRGILFSVAVALLIFAPFGRFMWQHPDAVNQRVNSMHAAYQDALAGDWLALREPVTAVLRMFSFRGDNDWRYHVAAKPVFDPVTSLFFYAGVALALQRALQQRALQQRAFKPPADGRGPAYALLLLWMGAMLTPNALLDANSSFLRAAGAVVPVYLLTAIGLDAAAQFLHTRWPGLGKRPYLPALVALGLLLTLADTWHSYFTIWNNHPIVRDVYQGDLAAMGRFLEEERPSDGQLPDSQPPRIFIAHPYAYDAAPRALAYYTQTPISWFAPAQTFVWSPAGANWYLLPLDETLPLPLPPETVTTAVPYANGDPAFTLYQFPSSPMTAPAHPMHVAFANGPDLTGYDLPATLYRGETVSLTLHWQIPPDQPAQPTQLTFTQVRLVDEQGNVWGESGRLLGYPQTSWQPGDQFQQTIPLDIPVTIPPVPISLRIDLAAGDGALYTVNGANQTGPVVARSRPLDSFTPGPDVTIFADALALTGASFSTLLEPGLAVDISLNWIALQPTAVDYRLQFQLFQPGAPDPILTQESPILPGLYPTSAWQPLEPVSSLHRLFIPADIPTTQTNLTLRAQLLPPTGDTPLPITQGSATLANVTLLVREHLFTAPPISHPLTATFGAAIQLLGYDLDNSRARPGGEIGLTLYWQAIATPDDHYTVFNHVIGAEGQLVAQFDSPPVGAAWLTGAWLPGEVIIDRRTILVGADVANGRYVIAIGLYNGNGRLPVTHNGRPQPDDQFILTDLTLNP